MYKILKWGSPIFSGNKTLVWVEYLTPAGSYCGRMTELHHCALYGLDSIFIWINGLIYPFGVTHRAKIPNQKIRSFIRK